jgi:hypothetical protein
MMSELLAYAELGFRHITDLQGADHILFLLVLAAVYRLRDWRAAIWVVTAFTAGHSLTLALAVTGVMRLPTPLIEFLIPVTIVATAVENMVARRSGRLGNRRVVFAGLFGLVHGAGFANYLRSLFMERIAVPLLGFNLGIEAGQLVVLVAAFGCFAVVDRALALAPSVRDGARYSSPLGLRAIGVSLVVAVVAARWAAERYPW